MTSSGGRVSTARRAMSPPRSTTSPTLRDQLAGVVNAPEVEPPRRDRDTLDAAESWIAPGGPGRR